MKNGVQYYGVFLMKGSTAYDLWEQMQKDPKVKAKLDAHLKEVDKKYKEMSGLS
jgi:hypothetical protein